MSELKMKFQENPRYFYYGILLAYLLSLLTIFTLRVTAGSGEVNVETNQIGQYVGVGQNDLTVSDLIYNPETGIVEVDVYIKKEQSMIDDLPDYEFAGLVFTDTDTYLPQEMIQVSENYYVVFFGDVPKDFQALSLTVAEVKEEDASADLTKMRYLQEDFKVDPAYEITEDTLHYEEKAIAFEISETENQITANQEERSALKEKIEQYEDKIKENEEEKKYLLSEEQAEIDSTNNKLVKEIVKMEQDIADLGRQNSQLKEKIALAEQKKDALKSTE